MILLIGGEKGGTGKTTLAVNLAALLSTLGYSVCIVDSDKQKSAYEWTQFRSSELNEIPAINKLGPIDEEVKKLGKKYDHVIVDAGGRDSVELRSAMLAADKFYSPVRASQFDLGSLQRLNDIVAEAKKVNRKLTAFICINCASTNPRVSDTVDAVEFISAYDEFVMSVIIKERAAFKKSGYTGLGIHELPYKDRSADAEIELSKLCKEVFNVEI